MELGLILLFLNLGGMEILVIALIVVLLFGGKKIPELMKGLGKGVRSFKEGMAGTDSDEKKEEKHVTEDKSVRDDDKR